MSDMTISTFNLNNKNRFFPDKISQRDAESVRSYMDDKSIDILALQQATRPLLFSLKKIFDGRVITMAPGGIYNPIANASCEYNSFISNMSVQTNFLIKRLESGSIFKLGINYRPRNIVRQTFDMASGEDVTLYNTHLTPDSYSEDVNLEQLKEVVDIIAEDQKTGEISNNIVLTGCLNTKPGSYNYEMFKMLLEDKCGIQLINVGKKTYKGHTDDKQVDYIGYSSNMELKDCNVTEMDTSNHSAIEATFRTR